MRLLIAGGGTGGHLLPAIAVARAWRERIPGGEVLLVGARRPLDERILRPSGIPYRLVPAGGVYGKTSCERLRSGGLLAAGVAASFCILARFRPHVVLGAGGYASAPAVLASWLTGRPVVLMEQNARPGAANRWLSRLARAVALGFPEAEGHFGGRCVTTGNPLRPEIEALALEARSGPGEIPTLLVFGGSQGSRALNEAVCRALPAWTARGLRFRAIHATGEADVEWVRRAHRDAGVEAEVSPFLSDMASAYRRADLAVARAGALTVSELMAAGVPAILVPLPLGAGRHQEGNAASAGEAAVVIAQQELEARLAFEVEALLGDKARLRAMSEAGRAKATPGAAMRIAQLCACAARGGRSFDRDPS
ncbi:MAG: undecaprenyldiphospho-muramoylpentapeptide beta-N-acetylglucosaminyltransferase [Candidatus Tectomicrobia bacterium]|nr:undecaprenyldiphospho-muramoylpentapeptide beta-N-acetylglucosaminyltransferase [Candidatus Tectomicrobia bacterium]